MTMLADRPPAAHTRILRRFRNILRDDPLLQEEVGSVDIYYARQLLYGAAPVGRSVAVILDAVPRGERAGTTVASQTRLYLGVLDTYKDSPDDDELLWAWEIVDHLGALAFEHHQMFDGAVRLTDGFVAFDVATAPVQVSGRLETVILEARATWESTLEPFTRQPLQ